MFASALRSRLVIAPLVAVVALGFTLPQSSGVSDLNGVIGHWSTSNDGGPALVVDGTKWGGKSNADSLGASAQRLFGAPAPDFVKNNTGEGTFPIAVHTATSSFANGTLRVRFKMVAGASDQNAGILFGLKPDGSYHYVRYNTKDGNVALWKYVNGAREVIAHGTAHVQLPLGSWQELVMRVEGPKVSGWIAGQDSVRVEHTLPAPVTGRVGLWVKRDAVTVFREYAVTPTR